MKLMFSPLEQFEILPLFILNLGFLDISLTNQTFILFLIFFFYFSYLFSLLNLKTASLYIVPNQWQIILELMFGAIAELVTSYISGNKSYIFFPLIFSLFFFIVLLNLIGLVPYSFTVTSHIVTTLSLSLSVFIGLNIICVREHKLEFFSLFLPAGTSFGLAFLLVPLEVISYLFKPLSLAIRLFCNMMAGHALLKVFAGFAWSLMTFSGVLYIMQYIPLLVLIPLYGLEFGVALIQAFVFTLLTCFYLNDAINLH